MLKEEIRSLAISLGADRCGFAAAGQVDAEADAAYARWIADGKHGEMAYCEKYAPQRRCPEMLLPGAKTIISCAFCYNSDARPALKIARYALVPDYHRAVKQMLLQLAARLEAIGGSARVAVDTLPLRERYWAVKAGVGFIGLNNQLIVPGIGSYVFLGEVLWTEAVEPDQPCTLHCQGCRACLRACPGGALDGHGGCDARRCVSYLTIECRTPQPPEKLHGWVYGCDACQQCCPHNASAPTAACAALQPDPAITGLTAEALRSLTGNQYRRLTAHSAMSRVPLKKLVQNLPSEA